MKKAISIILFIAMAITLSACSWNTEADKTQEEKASSSQSGTQSNTQSSTQSTEVGGSEQSASTTVTPPQTVSQTTANTSAKTTNTAATTVSTAPYSTSAGGYNHTGEPSEFDKAVFVGDSVTLKLSLYASKQRGMGKECLGTAKFLCAGSLSYTNALWELNRSDNVHPRLDGVKYRVPDGVKAAGADKVFIMLGMNDFMAYGYDATIQNAQTLINEILEKSPNVKIYVQSVTPILKSKEYGSKTNENVDKLNSMLKAMCAQNGWTYLNVASVMKASDGSLKSEYCSDPTSEGMGIHFTDLACEKWIAYLNSQI